MSGKKVEGNEEQRRAAARRARRHGTDPSARKETTGASKQPGHVSRHEAHDAKVAAIHQGKQRWQAIEARLESPARGAAGENARGKDPMFGAGNPEYTSEHEKVFTAVVAAQEEHGGEGVHLDEIARRSDLPRARVRELLHDLATAQRLVAEREGPDSPDLGPRFEEKPRL